ncbi:hypothetical protein KUTeg_004235 [Tegillarca granosa]|uniref:Carboxylesterase type B domain-containing protein n=1 Tax=Tegillarca granosa TaxID=220873 RepID=A0ABQ9FPD6_TEGGR|nr:hypothetical protein KUTeg_004235 [Tegillarca granosa]
MIWIHGGSFISGQASSHDGSDLALKGDVIVVTINYRLGIFGFVSSGDHLLPGNYGLWDQRMAIVWSGTILSPASLVKSPNLLTLTRLVDCGTTSDAFNNHSNVVNCLQQKSPQELLHASTAMAKSSGVLFTNVVGAVIDGEIILDYPMKILQNVTSPSYAFFRSLDVIIGATNGEGSVLSINQEFIKSTKDGISTSVFCGLLCKELAREFFKNNSLVSEAVCYEYRVKNGNTTEKAEQARQTANMRDSGRVDSSVVSEDCLFLNIVVPGRPVVSTKKAVMIWIHDNNYFTSGKGDAYDGSLLALKGDVIVVNFNYRLGLFGFLNSNDTKFKGNYGLWDQRLALTWVKNNIGHFGGNTSVITVFGDGTSVTLQTISPLNRGLFQRAIAQGGNALSPFAFSTAQTDFSDFYTS